MHKRNRIRQVNSRIHQGWNHFICMFTPLTGGTLIKFHRDLEGRLVNKFGPQFHPFVISARAAWSVVFDLHRFLDLALHIFFLWHFPWRVCFNHNNSINKIIDFLKVGLFRSFNIHQNKMLLKLTITTLLDSIPFNSTRSTTLPLWCRIAQDTWVIHGRPMRALLLVAGDCLAFI